MSWFDDRKVILEEFCNDHLDEIDARNSLGSESTKPSNNQLSKTMPSKKAEMNEKINQKMNVINKQNEEN